MRKVVIILSVLTLIIGSCKNKPTTTNNTEIDVSVQIEDTIANIGTNQTTTRQEKISVLVLPPADAVANAGSSPHIQQYLEKALAMDSTLNVIKFPYKKLMDVSYQQIFDKRYCKPIVDKVETDIIIMSELVTELRNGHIDFDLWNIRIKIYNTETDKQVNSMLKAENLSYKAVNEFIVKRRNELISEIKTIFTESE